MTSTVTHTRGQHRTRGGPGRARLLMFMTLGLLLAALTAETADGAQPESSLEVAAAANLDVASSSPPPTAPPPPRATSTSTSTTTSPPPLTTTAPTTAAPDREQGTRERLIINGVGDVNVDPWYIPALATNGYDHALSGLDGLFLEDDLTVINLECPASELGTKVPKQFNFRCDIAALPSLRANGVDVANQGNNHILDYGPDAMLDSIEQLREAGITPVGAGRNAAQAHAPALFDIKGWTVAVIGFGGVIPAANWLATEDRPGMADGDTIETMVAAVEAADELADLVVVTIHWGAELQTGPPADDIARATAMIEAGADVIFGHHSHRLGALSTELGRPVSWSLGNFVWPRLSAAGSDTAVAQVIVEPTGEIRACYLDVTIVSDGRPELDDPGRRTCDSEPSGGRDRVTGARS